eukprot:7625709-Lingulodinium_polyedra.AAC.1
MGYVHGPVRRLPEDHRRGVLRGDGPEAVAKLLDRRRQGRRSTAGGQVPASRPGDLKAHDVGRRGQGVHVRGNAAPEEPANGALALRVAAEGPRAGPERGHGVQGGRELA